MAKFLIWAMLIEIIIYVILMKENWSHMAKLFH